MISFVLEIYSDVSNTVNKESERHSKIIKLKNNFHEYIHVIENIKRDGDSPDELNAL